MDLPAVFDMFFRRQPYGGGFAVFAGLGTLLDALESFAFSDEDIGYLERAGIFEKDFLEYLSRFKFTGDLFSFDEGSIIFPNEPLVRVHADLIQAQIIEGLLLNHINFQSLIATKTARVYLASKKGQVMEFGLRRAQGPDGALSASRAAFIGGASSTSNTLAGKKFGIPVRGTMAHAWIMSFPSELQAFKTYAALYPDSSVFLIDTYDTLHSGIKNAIIAGSELAKSGHNFGVRLDSGDMQYLSTCVRKLLDQAGFPNAGITVSNDLDEGIIETLTANGAPITGWGVGTQMVSGGTESAFSGVYKLAARTASPTEAAAAQDGFIPVMKFSDNPEKTTNPGVKNVWRLFDENNMALADVLALNGEIIAPRQNGVFFHPAIDYRHFFITPHGAEQMLKARLQGGVRVEKKISAEQEIRAARAVMEKQLAMFDGTYSRRLNPHIYKVSITKALKDLKLKFIDARYNFVS